MRRTTWPLPWCGSGGPRRRPPPPPRRCGRSNCCRRRRRRRPAARRGNRPPPWRWPLPRCSRAPAPRSCCAPTTSAADCALPSVQHGSFPTGRTDRTTGCRQAGRRPCPLTIAFLSVLVPSGEIGVPLAVIVPFSQPMPLDRPPGRAGGPDMERVNTDDPVAHRLGRDDDPGGRQSPDLLRRQAAAAHADPGDGAASPAIPATATSSSPPRSSSCTPRRCCTTTWWTKARCGAASSRRGCSGATRRACWSATSCSARPSR